MLHMKLELSPQPPDLASKYASLDICTNSLRNRSHAMPVGLRLPLSKCATFLLSLFLASLASAQSPAPPEPQMVEVGGYRIALYIEGSSDITVVFESGGGDDSSVWADIAAEVRQRSGVRTLLYDRAGLGQSDPVPLPYRIDNDAAALQKALDEVGVSGDVVLVAHSYGGFIASLLAESDSRIAGLVLLDALLPGDLDDATVARILATYRPQYDGLREAAPDLAPRMIPMIEAYPATVERTRRVSLSETLPIIDVMAENTWGETVAERDARRRAHAAFVAASPAREAVFAEGSGHNVMQDRPDVVIDAVTSMVERVRSGQ